MLKSEIYKMNFDIYLYLYQNSHISLSVQHLLSKVATIVTAITIVLFLSILELEVNRTECILLYLASFTQITF